MKTTLFAAAAALAVGQALAQTTSTSANSSTSAAATGNSTMSTTSAAASGNSTATRTSAAVSGNGTMTTSSVPVSTGTSNSTNSTSGGGGGGSSFYSTLFATAHVQGAVEGYFNFSYTPSGIYVVGYNFSGFTNTTLGAYNYHVHTNPVAPYSGNNSVALSVARCNAAFGHLDPLNVTEELICSPLFPQYCQEGDLSGKHGPINATANGVALNFNYTAAYLRFFPQPFSILGRSVVIHGFNKTRLGCGNILSSVDGTLGGGNSTYQNNYPSVAPPNPTTTVSLAINGTINSAGLSAAGYTLAPPLPNDTVTGVFLTTSGGQEVAVPTTYTQTTALPTQA